MKLNILNIGNNKINEFNFKKFPSLKNLSLNNNLIRNLNIPTSLNLLTFLNISNNYISNIINLPENLESLDISGNKFEKILKLPEKLKNFNCNNNYISKLPNLPESLLTLNCGSNKLKNILKLPINLENLIISNNHIKKLENLPDKIISLNCEFNDINIVKSIPSEIVDFNCSHNKISELPELPYSLSDFNCSHNLLYYVPKSNNQNLYIDFSYNPIYEEIFPLIRTIKLPLSQRVYNNYNVNIITLPKGTILFRGYWDSKNIINDFIGFNPLEKYDDYYLFTNHNTFFYPYPYVVNDLLGDINSICMFCLTQDITIISEILPSQNKRNNMYRNLYTTTCDKITFMKNVKGISYDPCLTKDFIIKNMDVQGQICIFPEFFTNYEYIKNVDKIPFLKYRKNFMDASSLIGIPEIILHPLKERNLKPIKTNIKDVSYEWLKNNMNKYIYEPLYVENFIKDETYGHGKIDKIEIIDKLLSPEGATISGKNLHMTIDPLTSFYVIYEFCNEDVQKRCIPIEEINKLDFL